MSDELEQIRAEAHALQSLMDDPHPGLFSWNKAVLQLLSALSRHAAHGESCAEVNNTVVLGSGILARLEACPACGTIRLVIRGPGHHDTPWWCAGTCAPSEATR